MSSLITGHDAISKLIYINIGLIRYNIKSEKNVGSSIKLQIFTIQITSSKNIANYS